ncbi:hypothetical protein C8R44DRAFT_763071 [Mycena epipterygia]|nr:hypothetical protein C8R44DRAFT_763071 [Mycena epipterygia]
MLSWKEFSAWITIDGIETPEYSVETSEDQNTVTCWIASELGKKFSIHWENSSYRTHTAGEVKMDGNKCQAKLIYGHLVPRTVFKEGVTDGQTIKPFTFSSLALTDDDSFLGGSSHEDLGVIELCIYPVDLLNTPHVPGPTTDLSALKLHERSKKAVTQQITLAQSRKLPVPTNFVTTRRAGPDLVKFFFKYRPIDVLRANGIAPQLKRKAPDPEAERALTPDDDVAVTVGDVEETRILPEKEMKPPVKHEPGDVIDSTQDTRRSKRVKREARRPFIPRETIDLT